MKFERISYSESIEAVNASGNKKWFKSSADIVEIDDELRATQLAKDYVAETIRVALAQNSNYIPDPATFYSKASQVKAKNISDEVPYHSVKEDVEWANTKAKLESFETKLEAQAFLDTTPYKHTIEAKKIVNSKL